MVKFVRSASAAQGFAGSDPGCGPSTTHQAMLAEAASHMPQIEGRTTKTIQRCTRGLWGEKGQNKNL